MPPYYQNELSSEKNKNTSFSTLFLAIAKISNSGVPYLSASASTETPAIPNPQFEIKKTFNLFYLAKKGAIASAPFLEIALLLKSIFSKLPKCIAPVIKLVKDNGILSSFLPTKISLKSQDVKQGAFAR